MSEAFNQPSDMSDLLSTIPSFGVDYITDDKVLKLNESSTQFTDNDDKDTCNPK